MIHSCIDICALCKIFSSSIAIDIYGPEPSIVSVASFKNKNVTKI
jgi:hypothetical protein